MEELLKIIGALNDETRVKLLSFIYINGEVCVCDIESSFKMLQSRVSRHLKILKDGGFLKVKREGKWAYYSIVDDLDSFKKEALKKIEILDLNLPKLIRGCEV